MCGVTKSRRPASWNLKRGALIAKQREREKQKQQIYKTPVKTIPSSPFLIYGLRIIKKEEREKKWPPFEIPYWRK